MNPEKAQQFTRIASVGIAVALTYIGLYLALISAGVAQFMANGLAFFQAIVLQHAAQAAFTFQRPLADKTQIIRFAAMLSLGFVSSALITGPIATLFEIIPWIAALTVTLVLPVQNYALLNLWVFADPSTSQSDASS